MVFKTPTDENLIEFGIGMSADFILQTHIKADEAYCATPHDYADLMRCITIVEIFDIDINIMAGTDYVWDGLIKVWPTIIKLADAKQYIALNDILNKIHTESELIDEKDSE